VTLGLLVLRLPFRFGGGSVGVWVESGGVKVGSGGVAAELALEHVVGEARETDEGGLETDGDAEAHPAELGRTIAAFLSIRGGMESPRSPSGLSGFFAPVIAI